MTATAPIPDPKMLDTLARIGVGVGLNLQPGQDLIVTSPLEALPLARKVTEAAYAAGAGVVTVLLSDDEMTLARFRHARDDSFDRAPGWLYDGMGAAFMDNTARMAIRGEDPMLLAGQDPERVSRVAKATSKASRKAMEAITGFHTNWTILSYPAAGWARTIFPDLPEAEAVARLSDAIARACRLDQPDPVAAWEAHNAGLRERSAWLNAQDFAALHFRGPGADLTVGLSDGHRWMGGAGRARNGITCLPNIPTEEVFTTPHARRVDGTVRASKPLAYQGTLIEGIEVRFEGGRIVEARADKGQEVFTRLLDSDEGARRLGEVALVPHSSPISQSGLLFYNTLYDENAACHIALGQCYTECLKDGDTASPEEVAARGGNSSMIHVDWMIGNGEMDIDGITAQGDRVPVFRKGEWAA